MPELVKSIKLFREDFEVADLESDDLSAHKYLHQFSLYDNKGKLIEEATFTPDGQLEEKAIRTYDTGGFLAEEVYYAGEDEPAEHKTFEWDDQGRLKKEFKHYQDGSKDTMHVFYDEAGYPVKKQFTDEDDLVESTILYTYEGERLVEEKELDENGDLVTLQTWSFDQHGRPLEHTEWDAQNEQMIRMVEEYDENGRRRKISRYINDRLVDWQSFELDEKGRLIRIHDKNERYRSTHSLIYDNNDNLVLQEEVDPQGEVLTRIERQFDQENRPLESHVYINGRGQRMNQKYTIRYAYEFFDPS